MAETLLHDLPAVGGRLVPERYRGRVVSRVLPRCGLRLAQLHGGGPRRLGTRSSNLTDATAAHPIRTVRWAEAIHEDTDLDGIMWIGRQGNSQKTVVLFGDRVKSRELSVDPTLGRSFATPGRLRVAGRTLPGPQGGRDPAVVSRPSMVKQRER